MLNSGRGAMNIALKCKSWKPLDFTDFSFSPECSYCRTRQWETEIHFSLRVVALLDTDTLPRFLFNGTSVDPSVKKVCAYYGGYHFV